MKNTTINRHLKGFINKKLDFLENELGRIKKEKKDIKRMQNRFR